MNFIDTHTHLYAEEFDPDRDNVICNAIGKNVDILLLPAIDRSYFERMMQVIDLNRNHFLIVKKN